MRLFEKFLTDPVITIVDSVLTMFSNCILERKLIV